MHRSEAHAKSWVLVAGRSAGEAGASQNLFSGPTEGEVFATQASQAEPLVAAAEAPGCTQAWAPRPSAEGPAATYPEDTSAAVSTADRHLQRATDATARFAWELLSEEHAMLCSQIGSCEKRC